MILDSTNGLVTLRNAVKGRVLVFYTKGGLSVGNTSGATLPKLRRRDRADQGSHANGDLQLELALFQSAHVRAPGIPAAWSCAPPLAGDRVTVSFEVDNSYAFSSTPPSDVSQISIKLNPKDASATVPTNIVFNPSPSGTTTVTGTSNPTTNRFTALQNLASRDFRNFYPFPDTSGLLYGPDRDSLAGSLGYDIVSQFLTPVEGFILEPNIVPGSVQVTVNGVSTTRFQVDAASGTLTLLDDVLPTDRIVVTYEKVDSTPRRRPSLRVA